MKKLMILSIVVLLSVLLIADSKFDLVMNEISQDYIKIQKLLASDKTANETDNINELAEAMLVKISKLDEKEVTLANKDKLAGLQGKLNKAAKKIKKAKSIKTMRDAFGELSKPLALWTSLENPDGIYVAYCPMAKKSWLQDNNEVANPYYGSSMPRCGEIVSTPVNMKMDAHKCDDSCDHASMKMKDKDCGVACKDSEKKMDAHKCDDSCEHASMKMKDKDCGVACKDSEKKMDNHKCDDSCEHALLKKDCEMMGNDKKMDKHHG